MALDFPANPTDGEVFGSYVWSASKGVWQSREESAAPAVVSPVPPTTPNTGDIWVDSSDGISYVYYDDGSSGQWIEMISSGVVSLASKANLDGGNTFTGTQTLNTPLAIGSGGTGTSTGINLVPTGAIMQWFTNTAPAGWIFCHGQSTSGFPALASVIGATVPNLQTRVPVGRNSAGTGTFGSLGATGGTESVTLTANQSGLRQHRHSIRGGNNASVGSTEDGFARSNGTIDPNFRTGGITAEPGSAGSQGYGSGSIQQDALESHTNLQPYIVLNYIIKT